MGEKGRFWCKIPRVHSLFRWHLYLYLVPTCCSVLHHPRWGSQTHLWSNIIVLVVSSRIRNLVPTANMSQSQLKLVLAHGWRKDQQDCPRIRKKWGLGDTRKLDDGLRKTIPAHHYPASWMDICNYLVQQPGFKMFHKMVAFIHCHIDRHPVPCFYAQRFFSSLRK